MEIKNKIALVTGGANGLGFAYAKELLRNEAAHVAVLDLENSNGDGAVSKLNAEFGKGKAIFIICDVSKPQELEAGFAKTIEEFDGLDIVINNAGIMDDAQWELEISINFTAAVRGTLLGLQHMGKDKGGKGGTIINISSILGVTPSPTFPIYGATKHAIVGLSRSLSRTSHYEKTGVRILTMCPGGTETEMIITPNAARRALHIVGPEAVIARFNIMPTQTVDSVAQGMMHIIRDGVNGSIWLAAEGQPVYEIEFPDYPIKKVVAESQH